MYFDLLDDKTLQEKAKNIYDHYGHSNQVNKFLEEGAELVSEMARICLMRNGNFRPLNFDGVIDELADVTIMIHQLKGNTRQFVPRIFKNAKNSHEDLMKAVIHTQYAYVNNLDERVSSCLDNVLYHVYEFTISNNFTNFVRERIAVKIDRQISRMREEEELKNKVIGQTVMPKEKEETQEFQIIMPWFPRRLSPNARPHWAVKAKKAKQYRKTAKLLALKARGNQVLDKEARYSLRIIYYTPSARPHDDDNLIASVKAARDGIADGLGINDKNFVLLPIVVQGKKKGGRIIFNVKKLKKE